AVGLPIIAALIYAPFFFQEKAYENVFGKAGIEIPMGMDKRVIALNAADFDLERQALHSEPDETQASETDVEEPGETKTEETTPETKTTAGEASDEAKETKPASTSADADLTGPYYIIGGSYRSEQNAGEAASQYESQGYTCRILHANNGNKRVAIQSYGSVEAAYQQLDQLRQATGREDLWIHRE
ncbi:MAG: SPOR domain-containing protein, partial [Bacteroidota bacterium]